MIDGTIEIPIDMYESDGNPVDECRGTLDVTEDEVVLKRHVQVQWYCVGSGSKSRSRSCEGSPPSELAPESRNIVIPSILHPCIHPPSRRPTSTTGSQHTTHHSNHDDKPTPPPQRTMRPQNNL